MTMFEKTPLTKKIFEDLAAQCFAANERGEKVEWPLLQHGAAMEDRWIQAEGQLKENLMLECAMLRSMVRELQAKLLEAADYVRIAAAEEEAMNKHRRNPRYTESRMLKEINDLAYQDLPEIK